MFADSMSRSNHLMMSPFECATAAATVPKLGVVAKASCNEGPALRLRQCPRGQAEKMRKCKPVQVRGRWADCTTDSEYEEEGLESWRYGLATDEVDPTDDVSLAAPTASMLGLPAGMASSAGAIGSVKMNDGKKFQDDGVNTKDVEALADVFFRQLISRCEAATCSIVEKQVDNNDLDSMKHGGNQAALRRIDAFAELLQHCRKRLVAGDIAVQSGSEADATVALMVATAEADLSGQALRKPMEGKSQSGSLAPSCSATKLDFGLPVGMHKSFCAPSLVPPRSPTQFVMNEPLAEEINDTPENGVFGSLLRSTDAEENHQDSQLSSPQTANSEAANGDTNETLSQHLQELGGEHPQRVLCLRKINRLGFDSRDVLERHYSCQGLSSRIMVAHLFSRASRRRSARMRPAGVGFMVMESEADAERVLAFGEMQTINGEEISVRRFEPPKGDGSDGAFGGEEEAGE